MRIAPQFYLADEAFINAKSELFAASKLVFFAFVTFPIVHFFEEITVHGIKCFFGFIEKQINPNEVCQVELKSNCHEHKHSHTHHVFEGDISLFSLLIIAKVAYANEHLLHKIHHKLFPISGLLEPVLIDSTVAYWLFENFETLHSLFHLLEIGEAFKDIFIDHQSYTAQDFFKEAVDHCYFFKDAYHISYIEEMVGNITDTLNGYVDSVFLVDEL